MRKVVLSDSDFTMFDRDVGQEEYDFYQRHKDAFKRMWIEQGKNYWVRFVMTFRSFAVHHGIIKSYPGKAEKYETFVDQAFIYIHEQFVDGKFNSVKKFLKDIFNLATNSHTLPYLESKSYAKDPFYNKDTRDVFRSLFGPASEKTSYIKVYVLMPIYLRMGGSVIMCLQRWLEAEEMGEGDDESTWWTPPSKKLDNKHKPGSLMADVIDVKTPPPTEEQIMEWWMKDQKATGKGPEHIPFWKFGDPRLIDEDNPLYDADGALEESDWRKTLTLDKYKNLVLYAHRYLNPVNEKEADLYILAKSGLAVFYPPLPYMEERGYDEMEQEAIQSFKGVLEQHENGKWEHGKPRAVHIHREYGRQQVMLFDYKLNPNAKLSTKGTVLESVAISNRMDARLGETTVGLDGSLQYTNAGAGDTGSNTTKSENTKSRGAGDCDGNCGHAYDHSPNREKTRKRRKFCIIGLEMEKLRLE